MKTYKIYTTEGKFVSSAKGTNISSNDTSIYVYSDGTVVAIIPLSGGFVVVEEQ
jgi:hypothetical protein